MYKIAVMGDYDSIYGFATLGLDTFPVRTRRGSGRSCFSIWQGIMPSSILQRRLAAEFEQEIKFRERLLPAIILIPGVSGNTGKGIQGVKKSVEQAVGSDIIFRQFSRSIKE